MDFAMTVEAVLAFALTLYVTAVVPGPSVLGLVGCTLGQGPARACGFLFGLIAGDTVYLVLAAAGLSALVTALGEGFIVIKLAGAIYLMVLGIRIWRSAGSTEEPALTKPPSKGGTFLAGFAMTLGNPKHMVFYLSVLPIMVDMESLRIGEISILATVAMLTLTVALVPYIAAAARARHLVQSPKAIAPLKKTSGGALVLIGGAVATS